MIKGSTADNYGVQETSQPQDRQIDDVHEMIDGGRRNVEIRRYLM